jgi:hypothetical protein
MMKALLVEGLYYLSIFARDHSNYAGENLFKTLAGFGR